MRWRPFLLILLVALVPRLWLFAINLDHQDRWFTPDSIGYHNLALNLLHRGIFSQADKPPYGLDFDRTPVFPAFVAAVYAVSGDRPSAAMLAQILLSALNCWLLFLIVRPMLGERWAMAAALAQALSLSAITACEFLLTDTLFTFLLTIQLYLAYRYWARSNIWLIVSATATLSLMTLCRPISILWIWPQCFLLICETRLTLPRRLLNIAVSLLVCVAVLFPWMLRNRIHDGAWFVTVRAGDSLYLNAVAAMEAKRTGESAEVLRQRWQKQAEAVFASNPEAYRSAHSRNEYLLVRGKEKIRETPFLYARLHFQPYVFLPNITAFFETIGQTQPHRGTLDVLNRLGLMAAVRHYFGERTWLIAVVTPWILLLGVIYLGMILGLARWLIQRQWMALLFFLAFAVYYLILPGPVTLPRYREPAMPMIILTSVIGYAWAFSRLRSSAKPKLT